ncbi:hypothetical protein PCASD_25744 [Puccinia coronata f. sp. avenae]|uniref:Uncharacterized protein n=1 Tax=Puccinia coronata f. sp. avenae TaxID=200324 RepID=A0A2N5S3I9_9BASI|nr:hypothetical protein PCASD_25744 [Puccinia coronata f. sp. avenae]
MADMTARGLEDSAIIQQQQERITFLEEQFEQNKKAEAEKEKERLKSMDKWLATKVEEMMAEFMNSRTEATPQDIPIPETPQPQIRFSVPPTGPNIAASPAETRFGNNRDVKLPEEGEFTGLIDAKKANITFDGTDVEGFIKRLENIASILKCGSISLARQLPYIINNNKIGRSIELMEGHETGDWELLKKSLLRKWGRATPLRRYREGSITELVQKAVDKKGIKTNVEYRKFISEFEEMMDYFIRMEYNNLNLENGDPLWKALSDELKKEVTKELAHAKKLKKTKDDELNLKIVTTPSLAQLTFLPRSNHFLPQTTSFLKPLPSSLNHHFLPRLTDFLPRSPLFTSLISLLPYPSSSVVVLSSLLSFLSLKLLFRSNEALPMSTGDEIPKDESKSESKIVILKTDQKPSSSYKTTETIEMDKISQTILKSAIEAIPLLTLDNYTLWKNRVENVLDLQELSDGLTSPTGTLTTSQDESEIDAEEVARELDIGGDDESGEVEIDNISSVSADDDEEIAESL